ncbi:MAG: hypothetical protein RR359_00085 [Bacilli bacterium]
MNKEKQNKKLKKTLFLNSALFLLLIVTIYIGYNIFIGPKTLSSLLPDEAVWDGHTIATSFNKGNGTRENPYQISNGAEFIYFKNKIESSENNIYNTKYYKLSSNINLGGFSITAIGKKINTDLFLFKGHFNGDGYTIKNFKEIEPVTIDNIDYYGIFSIIENGAIENLNLEDINITLKNTVNEIVGGTLSGKLSNSSLIKNIATKNINIKSSTLGSSSIHKIGGIIGEQLDNSKIMHSMVEVIIDLPNYSYDGGTVGYLNTNAITSLENIIINSKVIKSTTSTNYIYGFKNTNSILNNIYKKIDNKNVSNLNNVNIDIASLLLEENTLLSEPYEWKMVGTSIELINKLAIKNSYQKESSTIKMHTISQHNSGISGNIVYVNDLESDWNKYTGLNYTSSNNGKLPTGINQNLYNEKTLAKFQINYYGNTTLFNNEILSASVSLTELQDTFTYYKVFNIISSPSGDYVKFPLIDNPFTNHPTDLAFNNWITNYPNAKIIYDKNYHQNIAIIPITYTNNIPDEIVIDFKASWMKAIVSYMSVDNSWSNSFTKFKPSGIYPLEITQTGNSNIIDKKYENAIMAGYYREKRIPLNSSLNGFYDNLGNLQTSGICTNNTGCIYYELIQYYNEYGAKEVIDSSQTYFYLVTRDTNILVLDKSVEDTWTTAESKPFTLTSVYNKTDYRSNIVWTVRAIAVTCYADTTIENILINSNQQDYIASPSSNIAAQRYLYGNWFNLRLGRGIKHLNNYKNFTTVLGGKNNASGSNTSVAKYSLIIESGYYNSIGVSNGRVANDFNNYLAAKGVYGNDFDRIKNDNSLLDIYFCAASSWGGVIYGENALSEAFDITVKSGSFGSGKYDLTSGIYVGGRSGGTYHASKKINYLGGYTYNLIGGPLTDSTRELVNDTYMYVSGGFIDMITGGAGTTATYGNRLIQVTGGTVNYSIFGGSNGVNGSGSDGLLNGSAFVYVGGNATVGLADNVTNNRTLYGSEAGSVFGIGNGRQGFDLIGSADNSTIIIDGNATINRNVYGGGNFGAVGISSSKPTTSTKIRINGGNIKGSVYGGGNRNGSGSSRISSTVDILMTSGKVFGNIYGGSNELGTIFGNVSIKMYGGEVGTSIYGGGQGGFVNNDNKGTFVTGNIDVVVGKTDILTIPSVLDSVYGGSAYGVVNGDSQNVNVSPNSTTVIINKGTITNAVYGGARGNTTFTPSVNGNILVNINGGNIGNVYGGNDAAGIPNGTIEVNLNGGTIGNAFGGGNNTGTNTTKITLAGATTTLLFGGSNSNGNINKTEILLLSGVANNVYGGNNLGGFVTNSFITMNNSNITGSVYGGGKFANTTNAEVHLNGGNALAAYGGGESASVTNTKVYLNGSSITSIYGGSNVTGDVSSAFINSTSGTSKNVYGGNNAGGTTSNVEMVINGGNIDNIYGGGNKAITHNVVVTTNGGIIGNIYGGGNLAEITNNVILNINNTTITDSIYGGGNLGNINKNVQLRINNSTITNNVYGGGNKADVIGNTTTGVSGTTVINGNLFGGGDSGAIGVELNNNSVATLNIAGATINKNVYGGSNTSVVYGTTNVNIGRKALEDINLKAGNIEIIGTVFGGGEANASGSEIFDYSFICVTVAIHINIDGKPYLSNAQKFNLTGSIFGSGNASSSSGTSDIYIGYLGTKSSPSRNISIQRSNTVIMDNSFIELSGATDRTNEYSTIKYSFNRIDLLKVKNNTTLLLKQNANLLKRLDSLVDINNIEVKSTVTIDDLTKQVAKNVDNRLYLMANKNLNISTNEAATSYGIINGMMFFGMYNSYNNGLLGYGLYDTNFGYGSVADAGDVIMGGSYVLGLHNLNHDITKDGFYTNYIDNAYTKITTAYINPTPPSATYYMWLIGTQAINYSFGLNASKYSSLGTYELSMLDFAKGNTIFNVIGFNCEGLSGGVTLKDASDVPKIATNDTEANSVLGLSMKSETTEWTMYGTTKFLSSNKGAYTGMKNYKTDNVSTAPSLMFYLYHAKNISLDANLGTVIITLQALTPINQIEYEVSLVTVTIDIMAKSYTDGNYYDSSITYDKKYEMPSSTTVNITNKSQFTAYYSLYAKGESLDKIYGNNNTYYHALTSNFVLPVGTKITLLDYETKTNTPGYYYYVVDDANYLTKQQELTNYHEVTYRLSDFIKMGSTSLTNKYSDKAANNLYYNSTNKVAMEEFLVIFDFKATTSAIVSPNNTILFELRNSEDRPIISVLGIRQDIMKYSLYNVTNVSLKEDAKFENNYVYHETDAKIIFSSMVTYDQTLNREPIIDTNYESSKMGLNISFKDNSGNTLSSSLLMGSLIKVNNDVTYVDSGGVFRVKLADKVSNLNPNISFYAKNKLPPGIYKMIITLFASNDGLHNSGTLAVDTKELTFTLVGDNNLIIVSSTPENKIVDKTTGLNMSGSKLEKYTVKYDSELINPNIRITLYKRTIINENDVNYVEMDIRKLFTSTFTFPAAVSLVAQTPFEYALSVNKAVDNLFQFELDNILATGTYKLVFRLYDNNHFIDEDTDSLIIKNNIIMP